MVAYHELYTPQERTAEIEQKQHFTSILHLQRVYYELTK